MMVGRFSVYGLCRIFFVFCFVVVVDIIRFIGKLNGLRPSHSLIVRYSEVFNAQMVVAQNQITHKPTHTLICRQENPHENVRICRHSLGITTFTKIVAEFLERT